MIRFLINNDVVELNEARADLTLLQFIREHRKKTGTKEGCAAGDCGACTVVLVEPASSNSSAELNYRTVNSCITLMSAVHGKQLLFVEHLNDGKHLHPVQQALVDHHGSQCGFCTPGFIMSMFALYHSNTKPNRDDVLHALSGNLCRCTGYRPIIDATLAVCEQTPDDQFTARQDATLSTLLSLSGEKPTGTGNIHTPTSREELKTLIQAHPNAQLVAGSTDLSLQFTQQLKDVNTLISVTHIDALKQCTKSEHSLILGAAVPLNDAAPLLLNAFPQVAELVTRFAPIGDMPPLLLALNAILHLDNGESVRMIPISTFFTGYRETMLAKDEWISAIEIPLKQPNQALAAYKISKRFEDDISAVCAVFSVTLDNGKVEAVSSGFGGVAAVPSTCEALEKVLKGKQFASKECLALGKQVLFDAFSPIDDVRATAEYRKTVLANLWHRFWLENQTVNHIETRVVQHA